MRGRERGKGREGGRERKNERMKKSEEWEGKEKESKNGINWRRKKRACYGKRYEWKRKEHEYTLKTRTGVIYLSRMEVVIRV